MASLATDPDEETLSYEELVERGFPSYEEWLERGKSFLEIMNRQKEEIERLTKSEETNARAWKQKYEAAEKKNRELEKKNQELYALLRDMIEQMEKIDGQNYWEYIGSMALNSQEIEERFATPEPESAGNAGATSEVNTD